MKKTFPVTVYTSCSNGDAVNAFPGVAVLKNGHILAVFQSADTKNSAFCTVRLARSPDRGRTWQDAGAPFALWQRQHPYSLHAGYLTELENGEIIFTLMLCDRRNGMDKLFFNPETGGALPICIGVSRSRDAGQSWSVPDVIATGRFDEFPVPVMAPVVKCADGELFLPFEVAKNYADATPWVHYAGGLISPDQGRHWTECVITAHDCTHRKMFWDNRIISLGGSRLFGMFWTFDNVVNGDAPVHSARSFDNGRTWSRPVATNITGQATFPARYGQRLLAVTVDRFHSHAIKLYSAEFPGVDWHWEDDIYVHSLAENAAGELNDALVQMQYWSFGLPTIAPLGEREFIVLWYAGRPEATSIYSINITME